VKDMNGQRVILPDNLQTWRGCDLVEGSAS